ncbi:MAG TPA: hydrogenase subunit MbhD domain-containing protein [Solirubrobacteraceae bacterium]|nr:hydrogenase subunit MbhD domain-containing protein [Solirubrobacteraceae bacterium]
MNALIAALLTLVAAGGLITVLIRDPARQAIAVGVFGLLLALLFFVLQAPDVALSELVVGSAALPAMLFLALAKVREQGAAREQDEPEQ